MPFTKLRIVIADVPRWRGQGVESSRLIHPLAPASGGYFYISVITFFNTYNLQHTTTPKIIPS
jgi:hypothetical protein